VSSFGGLLDFQDNPDFCAAVDGRLDRVDYQPVTISVDALAPSAAALLVRPDGYVCLTAATATDRDVSALTSTRQTWFGKAKTS
jgi:hypothetical protein